MSFLLKENPTATEGVRQWDAQTQSYCVIQDPLTELRDELQQVWRDLKEQDVGMNSECETDDGIHSGWKEAVSFVITIINTKIKEKA